MQNRKKANKLSESILDYNISRQIEIESYGYRFLRLNKFNLRPEHYGETKMDILDRFFKKRHLQLNDTDL